MTNTTMELLERVLRQQKDVDDYIGAVADALEQYRASGQPEDDKALRIAAREYLGII